MLLNVSAHYITLGVTRNTLITGFGIEPYEQWAEKYNRIGSRVY